MNKKYIKIKEKIPNFSVIIKENKLIAVFDKDINSLAIDAKIVNGDIKNDIRTIEIDSSDSIFRSSLKCDNTSYYIGEFTDLIGGYNLMDALRDNLFILVGENAEHINHKNISDCDFLSNNSVIEIPSPITFRFNFSLNSTDKMYTRYINKDDLPYGYMFFNEETKIYTNQIEGLNYITGKNFGFHFTDRELSVFSYNELLQKGLCILYREPICESFFDLYDIFDAMNVILRSIQIRNVYNISNFSNDDYYNDRILIEL